MLACGREAASYEALLRQVEKTAGWLSFKGIGRGDRVAVVMPNGPEMASLFLGITSVATCAPLNAAYQAGEFEFYLSDLKPRLVIVDAAIESAVRGVARAMGIETVTLHCDLSREAGSFELGEACSPTSFDGRIDYATGEDVALVLHTSGTTARPKIVPLTQANLCVSAVNVAASLGLTAADRCLNIMPLFHVHGLVGAVLSSLSSGASAVCTPGYNATEFYAWLAEFAPTWFTGVPTMHHGIAIRAEANRNLIASCPLRFIRSCSAALPPKIMAQLEEAFSVPVLEAYGMTEAAHQMTSNTLQRPRKPGSVGHPTGVDVAIMDEAGILLPAGAEGEVVIRGPNVTRGYENNPEANEKSFTGGWFRTGDRGRFDCDGDLFLTGRIKELIVRGGEKIAPREIDEALLAHPAVEQALGFALPDSVLGERVGAAVVLKAGIAATELQLCEFASTLLADFKVPEKIVFVAELPKGPTGKPQRIGLAERLGLNTPPAELAGITPAYCAPRNETEARLAAMWRDVLKMELAGVHDSFFAAGGDSILAIQLIARIRLDFAVELSAPRLFQMPTIEQQAEFILQQASGDVTGLDLPSVIHKDRLLLTSAQTRMWFLSMLDPETPVYNRPFAYRLKGDLDIARLQKGLSAVVQRHEILRTNYRECDGTVAGVVCDAFPVPLETVDLSGLPEAQRQAAAAQWMVKESARPFHLESDSVFRCGLARLAPDEHILLLVIHHIACDASSEPVIVNDLARAYNGTPFAAPCPQYAGYAAWQHAREAAMREKDLRWWKAQLAGAEQPCEIAGDFPRSQANRFSSSSVPLALDAATLDRCKALAGAAQTTVFTVLLAAFDALLHRHTGAEDVVVGTPVAARNHPAAEAMVGLFINTLALRTSAAGDPTFRRFLSRTWETVSGALEHQEAPFDAVVDAVQPRRPGGRSALFQVMFEYRNIAKPHLAMDALEAERIEFDRGVAPFDLTLDIEPAGGGVRGYLYYNTDLFERSTIERLAQHFVALLDDALKFPDRNLSQLRLMPAGELAQVLALGTNERRFPDTFVHRLFEQQVEKSPDAVAVVFEKQSLSYAQLNERANQLARYLQKLGVKPDQRVAICVERGLEMVVAMLAVLKSGAGYLPLDPTHPAERLRYLLGDSAPAALLTQGRLRQLFGNLGEILPVLDLAAASPAWSSQSADNLDCASVVLNPDHLAYVIYTSGSTGNPKGVMVEHASLTNFILSCQEEPGMQPEDCLLAVTTLSFDAAVLDIYLPLTTGARLRVLSQNQCADGDLLKEALRTGVTVMQATPATWRMLLEAGWEGTAGLTVLCGGEAMTVSLTHSLAARSAAVWNLYGPTENTVNSVVKNMAGTRDRVSIGRPVANTRVYILDGKGQPVPIGVMGELFIGGAGVARGYLNRPELTAERFLTDPFASDAGARMYKTGDLGRWLPDGNVEYLGRNDFQVKIRGMRVEVGEIEARLMEHPSVREAVVTALEDTPGEIRLIAYYTASTLGGADHEPLDSDELRSHLAAYLPGHMIPAAYVRLQSLPLTTSGKLDRKALPAPDAESYLSRSYEPPQGETESRLAAVWAEVLKLEKIGRYDNFFSLGGHSLYALQVVSRVRKAFNLDVPVSCCFQYPTIESLADAIEQLRAASQSNEQLRRILEEVEALPE